MNASSGFVTCHPQRLVAHMHCLLVQMNPYTQFVCADDLQISLRYVLGLMYIFRVFNERLMMSSQFICRHICR